MLLRAQRSEIWDLLAHSLSGRLLLLTLLYVMVSEVAIFIPSIGRFYVDQIGQRVETAELAILPFTEPSGDRLSAGLRRQLLIRAGAAGLPVGRLQDKLKIAPSTLSHHIKALVVVGLVTQVREATTLVCHANYEVMKGLVDFLVAECCADADSKDTRTAA